MGRNREKHDRFHLYIWQNANYHAVYLRIAYHQMKLNHYTSILAVPWAAASVENKNMNIVVLS